MARRPLVPPCPCGSGRGYAACCQPLHEGAAAPDAEALMRSRYSAYVLGLESYLLASWHSSTRPPALHVHDEPPPRWIGLTIHRAVQQDADHASVEFTARYRVGGRAQRLHETSRFVREAERWVYLDGKHADAEGE